MAYVEVVEEKIEDVIQVGTPARAADSVKMSTLIKDVQDKITRLVKAEIELAKVELIQKLKDSAIAIGLFVAAAFLLFFVFTALIGSLVAALAAAMPLWGAFLSTALILLLIAGLLALAGKRFLSLSKAERFDTPENVKTDLNRIKFALHRHRVKVKVNEDLIVPLAEVPGVAVVDDGVVGAPSVVSETVIGQPTVVEEDVVERVVARPTVVRESVLVSEPAVISEPVVVSDVVSEPGVIVGRPAVVTDGVALMAEPVVVSESEPVIGQGAVSAVEDVVVTDDTAIIDQIVITDDDGERSN